MMRTISVERLEAYRDRQYRRKPSLRLADEEDALAFVNAAGFCFLFGDKRIPAPTLWAAICGSSKPVPRQHNDADLGKAWRWKDSLPSHGRAYYGKLLRDTATLVSLQLLPAFYALSSNYGEIDDYLLQYEDGKLTVEAKSVYEALMNEGAMATSRLRQIAGLAGGGSNARRFDRALTELQRELKIVKVGISDANRWGYAYVYDLFVRAFPEIPVAARGIPSDEAMATIVLRYLRNVGSVTERRLQMLFRWESWEWERLTERLAAGGQVDRQVHIEGQRGACLALADSGL